MARKGTTKSRTGCYTCRIRKIKCDESKPCCQRCMGTGRQCDGYPREERRPPVRSAPRRLFPACTKPSEGRALQFFHTRAAKSLSGPYDPYFWTSLVLQLSNTEPIIRHAVIAISSLYEDYACKGRQLSRFETNEFALQHYTIAVAKLRDVRHAPLVLLACLLFVCIEAIQDNRAQAVLHCQHGLAILHSAGSTAIWARDCLAPIFHRMASWPVFFGGTVPSANQSPLGPVPGSPGKRITLDEANIFTEELLSRTVQLTNCMDEYRYGMWLDQPVRTDLIITQARLRQATQKFQPALEKLGQELLGRGAKCSDMDKLWYFCCKLRTDYCCLWTAAALDLDEMMYDRFLGRFKLMLRLAEDMKDMMKQRDQEPSWSTDFRFEIAYLPVVHVIVMKCRDLATRLQALRMVNDYGAAREGFWEPDKMYKLGRRIVEVEHGFILDEADRPVGCVEWDELPPSHMRVRDSYFDADGTIEGTVEGREQVGMPMGLVRRDIDGTVYLQNDFVFVSPKDQYSKPRLLRLDGSQVVSPFQRIGPAPTKCPLV